MMTDLDVLIVGGGPVGGSLALALQGSSLRVGLVEAMTDADRLNSAAGDRALALSRGTVQILKSLDLWDSIAPAAMDIRHIHVSDRGHFGKTRLHAADRCVDALGYVVVARVLEDAIQKALASTNVTRLTPARIMGLKAGHDSVYATIRQGEDSLNVSSRLLVAADGANSTVRTLLGIQQDIREYQQTAVVVDVHTGKDTDYTAYERFTLSGPLAFLPLGRRKCSVVWTLADDEAEDVLQHGEQEFTERLQDAFGHWLGPLTLASRPQGFPLKLSCAQKMVDDRVALIGNAMHQIHPVAGQGFNLGLRDAQVLAERLVTQLRLGGDIGDQAFLQAYAAARSKDLAEVVGFTDTLVRLFSTEFAPVSIARNLGMFMMDRVPMAKRLLTRRAMGYGRLG